MKPPFLIALGLLVLWQAHAQHAEKIAIAAQEIHANREEILAKYEAVAKNKSKEELLQDKVRFEQSISLMKTVLEKCATENLNLPVCSESSYFMLEALKLIKTRIDEKLAQMP